MKRVTLMLALTLVATAALAGSAQTGATTASSTTRLQTLEQDILIRLNATRASHGLRSVALSDSLQSAAVFHSRSMLAGGFFAHESRDGSSFSDRVERYYPSAGFEHWSVAENLLYATGEATGKTAIAAWLRSPAHRRNMLSPGWRDVGVGALQASAPGGDFRGEQTLVITLDFGVRATGDAQIAKPAKPVRRLLPVPPAQS